MNMRRFTGAVCLVFAPLIAMAQDSDGQPVGQPPLATPAPATAPDAQPSVVRSPILTIDSERLLLESAFGTRMRQEVEAASAVLAAENRRIEAELTTEEKALSDRRPSLDPAAFRTLADEFDAKVEKIRGEQEVKARQLTRDSEAEQSLFFDSIAPALERIMRDAGAAVIVEKRSVFLSQNIIDITGAAIRAIDAEIGDGAELKATKN